MDDTTFFSSDCDPTATGIIHCLRMLLDEAASLKLAGTLSALREAIEVCEAENRLQTAEALTPSRLRSAILH